MTATPFSCSLSAFAPDGGWQSLFFGATAPGTYTAFNAVASGSAPPAPDQLTIQNVAAVQYTFSNNSPNPCSFSFLEPAILSATGPFAIAPFQVGGLTFRQATLTAVTGSECFQFATAGASLTATPFSCGLSAFAPNGGWQSPFFGAIAPGAYTAFNAVANGSAPPAPDQLTITAQPEPASWALLAGRAAILAAFARKRQRTAGFAALAVGLSIPASAATVYNFTSFDGPGNNGGGTTVNGISNNGDLVGFSSDNAAAPTLFTTSSVARMA